MENSIAMGFAKGLFQEGGGRPRVLGRPGRGGVFQWGGRTCGLELSLGEGGRGKKEGRSIGVVGGFVVWGGWCGVVFLATPSPGGGGGGGGGGVLWGGGLEGGGVWGGGGGGGGLLL